MMGHQTARRALAGNTRMKQDRAHASSVLLAPHNRKHTALHVGCAQSVALRTEQETQMQAVHNAMQAFTQPLEGTPPAQAVLWGLIRIKLESLTALPASLGGFQTQREGKVRASFVGQGPTRQAMVRKLGAQTVMLENIKTS